MTDKNTIQIPNALLNDLNLSAGAKITYILLMKYERFINDNSGSFFVWSEKYMKRDTSKKYLTELTEKKYISKYGIQYYFYYFDNGEKKDYHNQSFDYDFKNKVDDYFCVKNELLFAKHNERSLTSEHKLFLIFFDRDIKTIDINKDWKPHFSTYEKYGLKKYTIKNIVESLKNKNIISYEVKYYGASKKQSLLTNMKINLI